MSQVIRSRAWSGRKAQPLWAVAWMLFLPFAADLSAAPVITGVDHSALPEGETFTLTGTGLGTVTSARLVWQRYDFSATVNAINDTTLEVVMPDLAQDTREHLLIIGSPGGSTVAVPSTFIEHTATGATGGGFPGTPHVVRAGATMSGGSGFSSTIVIETGGVLNNPNPNSSIIVAENGAVVDFTGVDSMFASQFFHSPDTVIIGTIPSGLVRHEIPAIEASFGLDTFTVGHGIDLTIVGDGTVTADPDQTYYRRNTSVTLTATSGASSTFSGWSGANTSETNPLMLSAGSGPIAITATFSTGWRLDITSMPGATVTTSPDATVFADGSTVTLTAAPDPGYEFLGWAGDASGTEPSTIITMDANKRVIPVVRLASDAFIPEITTADHFALPEGQAITLTGTGLGAVTSARLLWQRYDIAATVNAIDGTTLEVVMPDLVQDSREHLLLVESPAGSTVAIPPGFIEHTVSGTTGGGPPGTPQVVRAGATVSGGAGFSNVFMVETGGTLTNPPPHSTMILAANGAVVDFTGVASMFASQFFHSPDTVIIGTIPPGLVSHEITAIKASFGLGTFTVGHGIDLTIVGDGSVTTDPDQEYFPPNTNVTLTATPGPNSTFSGWTGANTSETNPLILRTGTGPIVLTANFSAGWLLDITSMPGATVTTSPDATVFADGSTVTLTAVLDPGYELLGWAGDASGTNLTTTVTMDGNKSVTPIVRLASDALIPRLTGADHFALPEGRTITLTGTRLAGTTAARMLWGRYDHPATIHGVDDTTLEIVMPDLAQEIREHILLVETPAGSTVAIPPGFFEHTATGINGGGPPGTPHVVRAGSTMSGGPGFSSAIMVETGGTLTNPPPGSTIIFAANGAVVDFTGVDSAIASQFFYSPNTLIIGDIPSGMVSRELTAIGASFNLGTFAVGYPLNLTIEGPGSVSVDPVKPFYSRNEIVTLTATPDPEAFFIRWIGPLSGNTSPTTFRIRGDGELIARFSTAPDYFRVWRLEHFTIEELSDLEISAFDADPDKDSLTNAAEYAFGSDPRMADGKRKLRVTKEKIDGEFHQFVEYYRPKNALDVAYRVLLSNDTLTWNFNGDDTDLVYSVERSVEAVDDETELVTVELYPETDSPKSFFVKISALLFE